MTVYNLTNNGSMAVTMISGETYDVDGNSTEVSGNYTCHLGSVKSKNRYQTKAECGRYKIIMCLY